MDGECLAPGLPRDVMTMSAVVAATLCPEAGHREELCPVVCQNSITLSSCYNPC